MIPIEDFSDFWVREASVVIGNVLDDLTRAAELGFSGFAHDVIPGDAIVGTDAFDDGIDVDLDALSLDERLDELNGHLPRDALVTGIGRSDDAFEIAFEFTDVGGNFAGDVLTANGWKIDTFAAGFFVENRHARFEVGELDIGDEVASEARAKPFIQPGNVFRALITRHDDLFLRTLECIEGMEELFHRPFAASQKLYVVQQQNIAIFSHAFAESNGAFIADCLDELVTEIFSRDVTHAEILSLKDISDCLHEMCLAQPDAPIEVEKRVFDAGGFGNGLSGTVGEVVGFTVDECVKREIGV